MITREELRQLASFECHLASEAAVSFYFKPPAPQDKSHREETILAKDVVRQTMQDLQSNGRRHPAMADLERILQLADNLRGDQSRARAILACNGSGIWKEFDVPTVAASTKVVVNRRFHLKPLAPVFSEFPRLWVAMVDRQRARVLDIQFEQVQELADLTNPVPRHGRSDGYGGYDGGHAERHEEDEFRRHYRTLAELLKNGAEKKQFEALVIGCHEVNWPEVESQLHALVRKKLLGRFSGDIGTLSDAQAKSEADRILHESLQRHHQDLIREAVEGARSNGLGVTGLRRVLRATEQGEVETLLMSSDYIARAVECTACGHIDSHLVRYCPLCGRATRKLEDVCEALVPAAIKNNIELVVVPRSEHFDRVGNIAALLRFRADRNVNQLMAS
ncbi:MAG TPA: hypothetical protein VFA90_16880 [Terriglobales bacterium]|nr:hypothetical protein [Terriglobales bacterium]